IPWAALWPCCALLTARTAAHAPPKTSMSSATPLARHGLATAFLPTCTTAPCPTPGASSTTTTWSPRRASFGSCTAVAATGCYSTAWATCWCGQIMSRRPSGWEARPCATTCSRHTKRRWWRVVAAQFGQKSLYRGREGVLDLAQQKGMQHVLHGAGLPVSEIQLLSERGWEAWRALQHARRRQASKLRRKRSAAKAANLEAGAVPRVEAAVPTMLEAVVVQPEETAGETETAAAEAAPDLEAQEQPGAQETSEENGGILHVSRRSCRLRGAKCRTICTLLGKAPVAPEAPTPMADPLPAQRQKAEHLTPIAEEDSEGAKAAPSPLPPPSPSPPSSPQSGQQSGRREPWWHAVAARLGWESAPSRSLGRSISSASSEEDSGDLADTRGPAGIAPSMPLVLDWGPGGARRTPEALMGDALQEHAEEQRAQQGGTAVPTSAATSSPSGQ
ncbi:hypothetical protein ABPG77_010421, partial [Micractinium sp. CCAP 211/92]